MGGLGRFSRELWKELSSRAAQTARGLSTEVNVFDSPLREARSMGVEQHDYWLG